jgi:hypothetical protein
VATYQVLVPFGALLYESLDGTSTMELPEAFDLPGMAVTRHGNGRYAAAIQVDAQNAEQAKRVGVRRVRETLCLMAINLSGFVIDFGQGVKGLRLDETYPSLVTSCVDADGKTLFAVSATDIGELIESASVVQQAVSFDLEARALAWRTEWPKWLATTVELNYLAVISHEDIPRLISLYSALEVMTNGLLGEPELVLSGFQQKKPLRRGLRAVLEEFDIRDDFIERVLQRVEGTQAKSQIDRIARALELLDVEASLEDIRSVTGVRGAVAHAGKSSDDGTLRHALDRTSKWVKAGLRNALERKPNHAPPSDRPRPRTGEGSQSNLLRDR